MIRLEEWIGQGNSTDDSIVDLAVGGVLGPEIRLENSMTILDAFEAGYD